MISTMDESIRYLLDKGMKVQRICHDYVATPKNSGIGYIFTPELLEDGEVFKEYIDKKFN